jgi:hypothetical protein
MFCGSGLYPRNPHGLVEDPKRFCIARRRKVAEKSEGSPMRELILLDRPGFHTRHVIVVSEAVVVVVIVCS